MTSMHYSDYQNAKSCKATDIYDAFTLNNIVVEEVDLSISHGLREYCAPNPHAGLTDIAFKTRSLLAFQKESTKPPHARTQNATVKHFGKRSWHNKTTNVVDAGSTPCPSQSSQHWSKPSLVLPINTLTSLFPRSDTPSSTTTLSSLATSTCAVC